MDIIEKLSSNDPHYTHLDLSKNDVSTEQLTKIANELEENCFIVRVSWREGSYYRDDLKKQIEDKVELNNNNFQRHPNDLIHGLLSSHVYADSEEGDEVQFSSEDGEKVVEWNKELQGWSVFKVFNDPEAGRYYSTAYRNDNKKQIVLAYRGTKPEFWDLLRSDSPFKTDFVGILGNKMVAQQVKAYVTTEEVINLAKEKGCNVSFTGHSLGAWLAELSLYFSVYSFKYLQCKAVTFDSPGSASAMEIFKSNVISHETNCDVRDLDITTYLSAPNAVNVCNPHVGKVYRIFPDIAGAKYTDQLGNLLKNLPKEKHTKPILMGLLSLAGHLLTPMLATFNLDTGKPINFEKVLDWPCIEYQPKDIKTIKKLIKGTLSSEPVSRTLSSIGMGAYEAFTSATIWTFVEVFAQFLRGKIRCEQFWEVYKFLEFNATDGYPLEETVLLPEEQFNLLYKGHYCTQELSPFKDDYNSKSSDWYLNRLCKLSRKKIDKKQISDDSKEALKNLKAMYEIQFERSKKYICVKSSSVQVDFLRKEIVRICEKYSELKEILEDKNAYSPQCEPQTQSAVIVSNLPHSSKNIVERLEVLEEIGRVLNQQKFVVISAFAGTGKSTIAKDYGRYVQEKFSHIVRFIDADSSAKIDAAYRLMATEMQIDIKDHTAENVMQLVLSRIENLRSSVLFIFDNVESSKDVEAYLGGVSNIKSGKVIITTRNNNLSSDLNLENNIKLDPFTREEAKSYIIKNSAKDRFCLRDMESLIDNLGNQSFVLPFRLSHAVAYLNQNKLFGVECFTKELPKNGDETATFLLLDLVNLSPLAWLVLQYAAYLDPDFISVELFIELLSIDEDTLQIVLNKLEDLSLMNFRRLANGRCGLQVHRLVQDLVKKYANKNLDHTLDKESIVEGIVQVLNFLFLPVIDMDWQVAQLVYPHLVKILQNNILCDKQIEMLRLMCTIGLYNLFLTCEYAQALKHFKQALELQQNWHQDQDNRSLFVYSLINTGHSYRCLGCPEKALKYYENALTVCKDDENGDTAKCLHWIGEAYLKLGRVQDALQYEEKCLEVQKASNLGQNHHDIASSLMSLGLLYVKQGNTEKGLKYCEDALGMQQALHSGKNHKVIASYLDDLGSINEELGENEKSLNYYKNAFEMRQALYQGQNHPEIAVSLNNLGVVYEHLGDTAKSLKYHESALEMEQVLYPGKNHPLIAVSLDNLGTAYERLGDPAKSLKYYENALEMRKALYPGKNHPDIARSLDNLGFLYKVLGENVKSLNYYENALEMRKALYPGKNHPDIAKSLDNLGFCYQVLGESAKSLNYYENALEMQKVLYQGKIHPDIARSLDILACIYEKLGDIEKSIEYFENALEMGQALYSGQNHPDIAKFLSDLGRTYGKLGESAKSLKFLEDALEMLQAVYSGQNHPGIAASLHNLGVVYENLGDTKKSLKYFENALEMYQAAYSGQNHPIIAASLQKLGIVYGNLGDHAKSKKYFEDALKIQQALYPGKNHPVIAASLHNLGMAYEKLGRMVEAIKCFEDALKMRLELFSRQNPVVPTSLHVLGLSYHKSGNIEKAAEYIKQAYIMASQTLDQSDDINSLRRYVDVNFPEFIARNETREFIIRRGSFDKSVFQIKEMLNEAVLVKIYEASSQGKWSSGLFLNRITTRLDWGVRGYLDEHFLCGQLGESSNIETIETARMLCFETICLGIIGVESKTKNFMCAKEFAQAYPKIIEKITNDHPEYFVDGSILRQCLNDPEILSRSLGNCNPQNS